MTCVRALLFRILIGCVTVAVVGPFLLWLIPKEKKWKKWIPNPVLLGVGGLYAGVNFMCISMLIVAIVYNLVLAKRCKKWFAKHQYVVDNIVLVDGYSPFLTCGGDSL